MHWREGFSLKDSGLISGPACPGGLRGSEAEMRGARGRGRRWTCSRAGAGCRPGGGAGSHGSGDGSGRRGLRLKRNCMERSRFGEMFTGSKNDE